jgi:hypothetical protein
VKVNLLGFLFDPCSARLRATVSLLGGLGALLTARLLIHPKYETDYEGQARWLKILVYGLSTHLIILSGLIYACATSQKQLPPTPSTAPLR